MKIYHAPNRRAPSLRRSSVPYAPPIPRRAFQQVVPVESDLRGCQESKGQLLALPVGANRFHDTPGERHVGL